ncbi:MAG: hypothetical protein DMF85_13185 [Acidobacteria bacterium]|nr:MAG: hypothetical protein DMF85_13185 [Acidobacteriota bacterium]
MSTSLRRAGSPAYPHDSPQLATAPERTAAAATDGGPGTFAPQLPPALSGTAGPIKTEVQQQPIYDPAHPNVVLATEWTWFEYEVDYRVEPTEVTEVVREFECEAYCRHTGNVEHSQCTMALCNDPDHFTHGLLMRGRYEPLADQMRQAQADARARAASLGIAPRDWVTDASSDALRRARELANAAVNKEIPHWAPACARQVRYYGVRRYDFVIKGRFTKHVRRRERGVESMRTEAAASHDATVAYVFLPQQEPIGVREPVVQCSCRPAASARTRPNRTPTYSGLGMNQQQKDEARRKYEEGEAPAPPGRGIGPAQSTTATLVGVVLPSDARPGDTITGTVVTDPKPYRDIPALRVVETTVPLLRNPEGKATLEHLDLSLGDGFSQPADQPVTVTLPPQGTSLPIEIARDDESEPLFTQKVPIASPPASPAVAQARAPRYETPAVAVTGAVQVIRGPLSGDARAISIDVDAEPARMVAATPRAIFWQLPDHTAAGRHVVSLHDGGTTVTLPIVVLTLTMSADRLELMRGETTSFHATVSGPEALPESAWKSGYAAELLTLPTVAARAPGFRPPSDRDGGEILLAIENGSRDTVTISPSKNEVVVLALDRGRFATGPYTFDGAIHSKRAGGFAVNSLVVPFVGPVYASSILDDLPPMPKEARDKQPAGEPKVEIEGDGTLVRTWPDGTKEVTDPDGRMVIRRPDGTREEIAKDVKVIQWANGSRIERYRNGTVVFHSADGSEVINTLDGTRYERLRSGRVRVRSKDGTTKTLTRKWRVTVHPDGKVEVVPR